MKKTRIEASEELLSDERIIELYWAREENAIRETDRKYGRVLFTVAYNILSDRLDSEEALNDTYLGTWNQIPPKRPNAFRVFLTKITRNVAVDKFRLKRAEKRIPSEFVVSLEELKECVACPSDVNQEFMLGEMIRILNEYLHTLSPREEFVFVCRYYYADSVAHIAKLLGLNESTVYRELTRIRQGLKECMEKEGYYEGS